VVFISSGAIYGSQSEQPLKEEVTPNPSSPYAVSKLAAEYYVRTIGALWGMETVNLRVFNAYGPGQQLPPVYTPVIPNFLRQAVLEGTIIIHGEGNQTRDYVYKDDVVRAMVAAAIAPDVNQLTINVGSGRDVSVRDLARMVLEATGKQPETMFNQRTDPGPDRMCADLTRAREKLGYQPQISLEDGIRLTLENDPRFTIK
jgi:UDP-glucose 4-epimerase